jgi:hypothetical protein
MIEKKTSRTVTAAQQSCQRLATRNWQRLATRTWQRLATRTWQRLATRAWQRLYVIAAALSLQNKRKADITPGEANTVKNSKARFQSIDGGGAVIF